ncbi:MAG: hypothetical protein IKZ12_03755 [Alistipes sp.]|nr:hypothetical protein [Alistipes sp.]
MNKRLRKLLYAWELVRCVGRMPRPAEVPIDLVMPVCEKDLEILPLALEGVRHQVQHPIAAIYIVAAPSPVVEAFCREHGCHFVDERTVLGYDACSLNVKITPSGRDRSGWIFQQLLKLSGCIGTSDYFLTMDSDHILLRPHTFLAEDRRTVFYGSREYHAPYYANMKRLIGLEANSRLSYVAHKMLFSRSELAELRSEIERKQGMPWDQAILASLDRTVLSGFSEFELYGNFVPAERKLQLPWRAHSLTHDHLADYETLRRRYSWRFAAVTFPDYRKRRK